MNTNCLKGIRCPGCRYEQRFEIFATAMFTVHDDGTDDYRDVEWSRNSPIRCSACGYWGTVSEFTVKERGNGERVPPVLPDLRCGNDCG